jgi:hypothetical protein
LLKRFWTVTVIIAILVCAVMASAKPDQKVILGDATIASDNLIRVPVSISNDNRLVAIDIALKYSDGVRIKEVNFENTRISNWDLKAQMLNDVNKTIVIMALPQMSMTKKSPLTAGSGKIAELVFEKIDPTVKTIMFEPVVIENPHHEVMFVYAIDEQGSPYQQWKEDPTIENRTVSLTATQSANVPKEFGLDQNYPNPFNPTTKISFALPQSANVRLEIFNVLGQAVRVLEDGAMDAGTHTVVWDGRNSNGGQVSSGLYFYRINAGSFSATKKMMMLK